MKRYNTQKQLSIAEFAMPFEANLDENNRWVVLSGVIPWDKFAEFYYKSFHPGAEHRPKMPVWFWEWSL